MDSGSIINRAIIVANTPGQTENVSDTSDDPNTGASDDPTIVTTTSSPSIKVLKAVTVSDNGDNVNGKGDLLQYNISIQNTGNVTLSGLTVSDTLTDGNSSTLTLTSGPYFSGSNQGSAQGSLKVSETANYIAFYLIDQQAVDSGKVINSASVIANSPGQTGNVSDTSDDPNTASLEDPTVVTITATPSIEVTKTASVTDSNGNNLVDTGDVIYYTLSIENKGQLTLSSLSISDTLTDGDGNVLSLGQQPYFVSSSLNSSPGSIKVGEKVIYKAFYIIQQSVIASGSVINSAIVFANSPGQSANVSDTSDDGNDNDGNTVDDPTVVNVSTLSLIHI